MEPLLSSRNTDFFTQTLYLCACACDNEEEEGAHSKKEEMKHRKTMKNKTNIMRKRMKKN